MLRIVLCLGGCVGGMLMLHYSSITYLSMLFFVFAGLQLWVIVNAFLSKPKTIVDLMGFKWSLNDFCRGWLITGMTGSGKTTSAINNLLWQVSKNCPEWGGVCIDEKGLFWETLTVMFEKLGRKDDLILLKVRPDNACDDWTPEHTFNFLDIPGITYSAHAKTICDVASSLGQTGGNAFFKTQAQIHIEWGLKALNQGGYYVNLKECYEILTSDEHLESVLEVLNEKGTTEAREVIDHFHSNYLSQPPEQLGGVKQTIFNYLKYFTDPVISEVFCPAKSTMAFESIDDSKVLCLSIPQKYQVERRYINTLLKLTFYRHAIRRFDKSAFLRKKDNLIVLWADEAQKVVTANEDGMSDYNTVDVIREAKATVVAATQSFLSLIPPMGNENKTKVFISNMGNRITFKAADEESAKMAADTVGKKKIKKYTHSSSKASSSKSFSLEEKYGVEPHEFRQFKKFQAVLQHCEKGWKKGILKPLNPKGKRPSWY